MTIFTKPPVKRIAAGVALATFAVAASAAPANGVGINLGDFNIYTPVIMSVDMMKQADEWLTQCDSWVSGTNCSNFAPGKSGWDTGEQNKLQLDEHGWPLRLPAANDGSVKYRKVATVITGHGSQAPGKYIVTYEGAGTLTYNGVGKKNSAESKPGRDVVDVSADDQGFWIVIEATDPGNHLRNIRVFAPGGACANDLTVYAANAAQCAGKGAYTPFENFPRDQLFHPKFVQDVKAFRVARFMDWQDTNFTEITTWESRPKRKDRVWTGVNGVPIGVMVNLANIAGVDPWLNIPAKADDGYVRNFAKQVKAKLAPSAKVYIEYSNETWNYMFPAAHYMLDMGKKQWKVTSETNEYMLQANWYGQRSAQICNIVKSEFGADAGRVICTLGVQSANSWLADYTLQCPVAAKTLGGSCASKHGAMATAPYFGYYFAMPQFRSTINSWMSEPDGGLSKVFEEITGKDASGKTITPPLYAKGSGAPQGALAQSALWMRDNKKVADAHGLAMISYEGGQHLTGDGADQKFTDLMIKASHDPRMGAAYATHFNDWRSTGGHVYTYFNHINLDSQWGMWGLKQTIDDIKQPKWVEVMRQAKMACWWGDCASKH